jgi:hypothetical protein
MNDKRLSAFGWMQSSSYSPLSPFSAHRFFITRQHFFFAA